MSLLARAGLMLFIFGCFGWHEACQTYETKGEKESSLAKAIVSFAVCTLGGAMFLIG